MSPVYVKESSGATADVTLNSAAWFPEGCAGGWACNVIELTITGTSAQPFKYDETHLTAAYDPWRDDANRHRLGGSYMVNYQKINKLPTLRTGSVTNGQTAHGFVGYDQQGQGDLYIEFNDPDSGGTTPEAGWKVHT